LAAFTLSLVRIAILIALGLVFTAGLGIGAQLISRDSAAPPRTHDPAAVKPVERTPRTPTKNATAGRAKRPRIRVTAPVDHRGREGIEEAEVDSHEDASSADG
jgi:hypothetical protein